MEADAPPTDPIAREMDRMTRPHTPPSFTPTRSVLLLLARVGAAGVALAALVAPLSLPSAARADDKDKKEEKPKEPPTNDPQEILRRIREEAAKAGVDVNKPAPPPAQPAAQPPAQPPAQPAAQPSAQPATPPPATPAAAAPTGPPAPAPISGLKSTPGAGPQPPRPGMPGVPGQPQMPAVPGLPNAAPAAGGINPVTNVNPADAIQGDVFNFNFTEPVDLTLLVTYVRDALDLQIIFMDGGLAGQKIFLNSPVTVKREQVLYFLTMLLEQKEYTLIQDRTGIYLVLPKNQITGSKPAASEFSTTRIIRTPNIKPSSLQTAIQGLINSNRGGQTAGVQPIYMDDLGLIIVTESPRVLMLIEEFISTLVAERSDLRFFRFELQNISAASARDRVLELLGVQSQRLGGAPVGQPGQPVPIAGPTSNITNLGERITIDPASNALLLRGRADERSLLNDLLAVVDVPNSMLTRWYPVGLKTSEAVASAGAAEQLGSITSFESSESGGRGGGIRAGQAQQPGQLVGGVGSSQSAPSAGAGFTIYPEAGGFFYRGTESQHRRVAALVESMRGISADEVVTYEFYKLRHGKAEDVAEVIQNLLSNSAPSGNRGGLLGSDLGTRNRRTANPPRGVNEPRAAASANQPGAENSVADLEGADVFVLADEPNNQVVVKAPAKLQPQFRRLIDRIDLRRPQVYIDAKIVAVNEGDDFRLAVEAQQIIGQFAFNTNFGLGSLTTGTGTSQTGGLTSVKNPVTNLPGITAALIRSKDVPFIVTALARDTRGRIIASPQLLVDDNTEAEISSIEQQPTSTTTQQQGNAQVSGFAGFEDAGPRLTVKPQISDGGYLRLEYTLELSSFTGSGTSSLPPPRQKNEIRSESVTIPTDATIVIGGLTLENVGKTIVKVPLIGDIPLVGQLFRDESETKRRTTLYAFITPKIMRDPSFADLRLLTKAPLVLVDLPAEFPPPRPERIDILDTARWESEQTREDQDNAAPRPQPASPELGAPVRRDPPMHADPE